MSVNESKYVYFVPTKYSEFVETIKLFLQSKEPGTIISPPQNGMPQRIEQLIQDYQSSFDRPLISLNLGPGCEDTEKVRELLSTQESKFNNSPIYLLVNNADYCLKSKNMSAINELLRLQYASDRLKTVYFFESNIASPHYFSLLNQTHLFAQVYYYPLYDDDDAERFVYYSAQEWQMPKLSKKTVQKIVSLCAGQMWLLRHVLREYRINPKIDLGNMMSSAGILFRLEQIAQSFTSEEINVLLGKATGDSLDYQHLHKLQLIKNNKCVIPLLYQYLLHKRKSLFLQIRGGEIVCNNVNLKHSFTKQEQELIKLLLGLPGKAVTRDEIANVIWGQEVEEKYSPWAIEQLVKRVRAKFGEIGLHPAMLKTVRNVGYRIEV